MVRIAGLRPNRNWIASLPLPAYFGVITVLYGVLTWAFDALGDHRHATPVQLVLHIVLGSIWGAVMTGIVAFQRRRFGGSVLQVASARAVRTGIAPHDANVVTWVPIIERRLRVLRRSRWLSPVLVSPIIVFAVIGWVLSPAAAVPALWLVVISVALVAVSEVQVARYVPRARAVLDQLRTSESRHVEAAEPAVVVDDRRPRALPAGLAACAIAAAAIVIQAAIFMSTPGDVAHAAQRVSIDGHISLARAEHLAGIAVAIVVTYWSVLVLALVVFGWFAFRGRNWARAALVPTALVSLIEFIAHTPVALALPVATSAAVVLLYLPSSSRYFSSRRRHPGGVAGPAD